MKWEPTKCAVICEDRRQVEDDNIKLYIGGGEIAKTLAATYLGVSLTSRGISDEMYVQRGVKAVRRAKDIAMAARLDTKSPESRVKFIV